MSQKYTILLWADGLWHVFDRQGNVLHKSYTPWENKIDDKWETDEIFLAVPKKQMIESWDKIEKNEKQ